MAKTSSTAKSGKAEEKSQSGADAPLAEEQAADGADQGAAAEVGASEAAAVPESLERKGDAGDPSDLEKAPAGGPVMRQGEPGVPLPSPTLRKNDRQNPLRPDALGPNDPGDIAPPVPAPEVKAIGAPLKFLPQDQLRSRALSLKAELAKAAAEDQRSLEVQWGKETEEPTVAVQILPRVRSGEALSKIIEAVAQKAGMSLREHRQVGRSELLVFNVHAV